VSKTMTFLRECPVCGKHTKPGKLGDHLHEEHPEYKWSKKKLEGNVSEHYYCDMPECGLVINGFRHLIEHYERLHPEVITPVAQRKTQSIDRPRASTIINEGSVTPSALDRLLEQVNINTGLLKEEQKRNRELVERCTAYAARIVELQNQLSQDTTRRY